VIPFHSRARVLGKGGKANEFLQARMSIATNSAAIGDDLLLACFVYHPSIERER
jgi:hypothetical protein